MKASSSLVGVTGSMLNMARIYDKVHRKQALENENLQRAQGALTFIIENTTSRAYYTKINSRPLLSSRRLASIIYRFKYLP